MKEKAERTAETRRQEAYHSLISRLEIVEAKLRFAVDDAKIYDLRDDYFARLRDLLDKAQSLLGDISFTQI